MDWRYHLLKHAGYSSYCRETSGKYLEFIGTSGVGKTTLFNKSVARLKNRWLFAYHLDFLKRNIPPCEIDGILMQILEAKLEKIYSSNSFCPWHSLLDLKLSVKVMYETMLIANSAQPKGYASAEGLFRHFPAEILRLGEKFPVQLWKNRAFVYLRARSPETALSRLRSREMDRARTESMRARSEDQILNNIVNDQEMFESIVDKARSNRCPVLVLEAENQVEDSIQRIMKFESSLYLEFGRQENNDISTQLDAVNR